MSILKKHSPKYAVQIDINDLSSAVSVLQDQLSCHFYSDQLRSEILTKLMAQTCLVDRNEIRPIFNCKPTDFLLKLCDIFCHNNADVFEGFLTILCNLEKWPNYANKFREIICSCFPGSVTRIPVVVLAELQPNEPSTKQNAPNDAADSESMNPSDFVNAQLEEEEVKGLGGNFGFMRRHKSTDSLLINEDCYSGLRRRRTHKDFNSLPIRNVYQNLLSAGIDDNQVLYKVNDIYTASSAQTFCTEKTPFLPKRIDKDTDGDLSESHVIEISGVNEIFEPNTTQFSKLQKCIAVILSILSIGILIGVVIILDANTKISYSGSVANVLLPHENSDNYSARLNEIRNASSSYDFSANEIVLPNGMFSWTHSRRKKQNLDDNKLH